MSDLPQVVFSAETSSLWSVDSMQNSNTLDMMQRFANDWLRNQRFLFLNDVLRILRLPRTREGQNLGWVAPEEWNEENPPLRLIMTKRDMYENITLEFNVDGDILDKINWSSS